MADEGTVRCRIDAHDPTWEPFVPDTLDERVQNLAQVKATEGVLYAGTEGRAYSDDDLGRCPGQCWPDFLQPGVTDIAVQVVDELLRIPGLRQILELIPSLTFHAVPCTRPRVVIGIGQSTENAIGPRGVRGEIADVWGSRFDGALTLPSPGRFRPGRHGFGLCQGSG